MREWAGVDPENGAPQWYTTDANGNRVITHNYAKADQVALDKRATPSVFGSFSTTLTYKNFDFNAVFGYSMGAYIYNYSRQEYDSDGAYTDRNQFSLQKGGRDGHRRETLQHTQLLPITTHLTLTRRQLAT